MKKEPSANHAALYYQIFGLKPGRGEQRRLKIVEAFIELVATKGLDNVSFETIAKKVGMIRTHVAYYFANREELIKTAVRFTISSSQQEMIGKIELAKNWRERLALTVEGPLLWLEKNPRHASVLALFTYLCTFDPRYRQIQNSVQAIGEQRLAAAISDVPGITPQETQSLARLIQAAISGYLQLSFCSDYPLSHREVRDTLVRSATHWVEEIENRKRKKS